MNKLKGTSDARLSSVTVITHTGEVKDAKHELTQPTLKSVKQIVEAGPDCVNTPVLCVFIYTGLE